MRKTPLLLSVLLLFLLLIACVPKAAPAPTSTPAPAPAAAAPKGLAVAVPAGSTKAAWEIEWEKTLAAARQEGKIVIHTVAGGLVPRTISKIADMEGIQAEVLSMRSAEFLPRIFVERRAGLYLNDMYLGGYGSVMKSAKPAGILEPLDSALILPHLTNAEVIKNVWYQGTLPWADKDHTVFIIALQPGTAITINTELVKPGEVKSWRDLLDTRWSGKVAFNDPTVAGYGSMCFQTMVYLMGEDYVKELVKAKPILVRDQRQLVDWLAHGKIAIAVAAPVEILVEFTQVGAPVKPVMPQEGTWLGAGNAGGVDWFKNSPHPNASKVFFNWLTTKEAQDILAPAGGFHSTRVDTSTAHLLPGLARTEGAKYFPAYAEEYILKQPVTDKLANDLFGTMAGK